MRDGVLGLDDATAAPDLGGGTGGGLRLFFLDGLTGVVMPPLLLPYEKDVGVDKLGLLANGTGGGASRVLVASMPFAVAVEAVEAANLIEPLLIPRGLVAVAVFGVVAAS